MASWGRAGLAMLAFATLATPVPPRPLEPPRGAATAALDATPILLHEGELGRRTVGALTFLEGWALASDDPRFGGISAMAVEGDGIVAISDSGILLGFAVPGRGPAAVAVVPLPDGPGDPTRKADRDTEAMFIAGSTAWIAFENQNQIWRFRRPGWRAEARAAPSAMGRWPANRGAEGMVRLADGRFLITSESLAPDRTSDALLFPGDPTGCGDPVQLRFRPARGYRITDVGQLSGGRLLLLQRRFTLLDGASAKLAIVDVAQLAPGAIIEAREIAHLAAPLAIDNMEALSVTREGGRTIIWIASDDNYFPLQRTLLMKFALTE